MVHKLILINKLFTEIKILYFQRNFLYIMYRIDCIEVASVINIFRYLYNTKLKEMSALP